MEPRGPNGEKIRSFGAKTLKKLQFQTYFLSKRTLSDNNIASGAFYNENYGVK